LFYPHFEVTFPLVFLIAGCQYIDMVCIYCGSKTQVTNSRHQRRANQTWRRRECINCQAVFTTEEQAKLGEHWLVEHISGKDTQKSKFEAFERDVLFLSLYESLKHRNNLVKEARELTDTVISKLAASVRDGRIQTATIAQVCLVVLNRFDKAAATSYEAFHK
jgi:transcriptional regulator NrdR family protein